MPNFMFVRRRLHGHQTSEKTTSRRESRYSAANLLLLRRIGKSIQLSSDQCSSVQSQWSSGQVQGGFQGERRRFKSQLGSQFLF
jgi:hypothetical protein